MTGAERLILALAVAIAITLGWTLVARGHDMQGHFKPHAYPTDGQMLSFLFGKRIGSGPDGPLINCCTYGGNGDCSEVRDDEIEPVDGGFIYYGHFVKTEDATLSPDGKLYVCQHKGKAPHCLFFTRPLS
jgi:hypothetical protein